MSSRLVAQRATQSASFDCFAVQIATHGRLWVRLSHSYRNKQTVTIHYTVMDSNVLILNFLKNIGNIVTYIM